MINYFQKLFDRIALAVLRPALIQPEVEQRLFGLVDDESTVVERLPSDIGLHKLHTCKALASPVRVMAVEEEDHLVVIMHLDSESIYEIDIDLFGLIFEPLEVETA